MLGGGQLGRYFVMSAHRLGYKVIVLDPDPISIAGAAADEQIVAAYDDTDALRDLASRCDAITCEFENVPAASLALLEQYKPVRPAASAVRVCQDRREEKAFLTRAGVPVAPNLTLLPGEPLPALPSDLFPAILKTAREGYDGKGQWTIHNAGELPAALAASGVPCVLENACHWRGSLPSPWPAVRAVLSVPCLWCRTGTAAASWIRPAPRPMCPPWSAKPSASPSTSSPPSTMWVC